MARSTNRAFVLLAFRVFRVFRGQKNVCPVGNLIGQLADLSNSV